MFYIIFCFINRFEIITDNDFSINIKHLMEKKNPQHFHVEGMLPV